MNAHRTHTLGLLASALIASVLYLSYEFTQAHTQALALSQRAQAAQYQSLAAKAQVQNLQSLVAMQRTEIKASRHIGLLQMSPGPWQAFKATFYAPTGGEGDGLVTYSGKTVHQGWTCAVDPKQIPLGSVIEVKFADGQTQVLQALDTGGAIKGKHIDVFVWDAAKAVKLGVQQVQVRILLRGGK